MGAVNINRVLLTGNLTADPELRSMPDGTSVGRLRVAVNDRVKRGEEWVDHVDYFDVTVWGPLAENCHRYLSKGRGVAVDGKLRLKQWQASDGTNRSAVEVEVSGFSGRVQFLSNGRRDDPGAAAYGAPVGGAGFNAPADTGGFGAAAPPPGDSIPFAPSVI
jgi:single-strand DNA-binding protein